MDNTPLAHDPSVAVYELPPADDVCRETHDDDVDDVQRDRALLRQNAKWFCRLRWIVVVFLATAGGSAFFPQALASVGLELQPGWPFTAAAVLAAANAAYLMALQRLPGTASVSTLRLLLWAQIIIDLVVLAAVTHFVGANTTYAGFSYLFHIVLACIFFRRGHSLAVVTVATVLHAGCLVLEYVGSLEPRCVLMAAKAHMAHPLVIWQPVSMFCIWGIIWYLVSRLASELRQREQQLAAINRRLEASSRERSRHMLQTTHQLKAPFAAIHANTQLLLGGYRGDLPESCEAVVRKISQRAQMLSQQIQDMLQLANLRSEAQSAPPAAAIDVAKMVRALAARAEPSAALRRIRIETDVVPVRVRAAEDHLKMLIDNLLSNAVNYSYDGGCVRVTCRREGRTSAVLTVRDHGIGIPEEKLPQVFHDYFRTKEAALHNKSSTGLGLAIVRHVANALNLSVAVESMPGWGTRFTVKLPALDDREIHL